MWHGWDTENEVAYRSDGAGRLRDVGVIQYPDPCHDDDPVYAVFSDGEKVVLHELSVGEHKAILETQEKKLCTHPFAMRKVGYCGERSHRQESANQLV